MAVLSPAFSAAARTGARAAESSCRSSVTTRGTSEPLLCSDTAIRLRSVLRRYSMREGLPGQRRAWTRPVESANTLAAALEPSNTVIITASAGTALKTLQAAPVSAFRGDSADELLYRRLTAKAIPASMSASTAITTIVALFPILCKDSEYF